MTRAVGNWLAIKIEGMACSIPVNVILLSAVYFHLRLVYTLQFVAFLKQPFSFKAEHIYLSLGVNGQTHVSTGVLGGSRVSQGKESLE